MRIFLFGFFAKHKVGKVSCVYASVYLNTQFVTRSKRNLNYDLLRLYKVVPKNNVNTVNVIYGAATFVFFMSHLITVYHINGMFVFADVISIHFLPVYKVVQI